MSVEQTGHVIWLTGISGSGKTTLGSRLTQELSRGGCRAEFLDGDVVRAFFEDSLGFTREARTAQLKRVAFTASMLARHNVQVVVAAIAGHYEIRDFIRRKLGDAYIQVFVKASLEQVMARDPQGHYEKYRTGKMANLVGVDDPYEVPRNPDVVVDTDHETVDQSLGQIREFLVEQGLPLGRP